MYVQSQYAIDPACVVMPNAPMVDHNLAILCWNVRRLNQPARREIVCDMLQSAKPNLVCLQETKLCQIDQPLANDFLSQRLANFIYMPADNTRGGVLTAWDADVYNVSPLQIANFSVTTKVKVIATGAHFILTNVYVLCEDQEKPFFLQELISMAPVINLGYAWETST